MGIKSVPKWIENLEEEDISFIKRFLINDKLDFETGKILVS